MALCSPWARGGGGRAGPTLASQGTRQVKSGKTQYKGGSSAELRTRVSDTPRERCHSHGDSLAPPSTYSRICRLLLTIKASARAWAPATPTEATCRLQENKDPSAHVVR